MMARPCLVGEGGGGGAIDCKHNNWLVTVYKQALESGKLQQRKFTSAGIFETHWLVGFRLLKNDPQVHSELAIKVIRLLSYCVAQVVTVIKL